MNRTCVYINNVHHEEEFIHAVFFLFSKVCVGRTLSFISSFASASVVVVVLRSLLLLLSSLRRRLPDFTGMKTLPLLLTLAYLCITSGAFSSSVVLSLSSRYTNANTFSNVGCNGARKWTHIVIFIFSTHSPYLYGADYPSGVSPRNGRH